MADATSAQDVAKARLVEESNGLTEIPIEPAGTTKASSSAVSPRYGALHNADRFVRLEGEALPPQGFVGKTAAFLTGLSLRGKILLGALGLAAVLAIAIPVAIALGRRSHSVPAMQDECAYSEYRLSGAFTPSAYTVNWQLQLGAPPYSFFGATTIQVTAASAAVGAIPQSCLQLHSHPSLLILSASLDGQAISSWTSNAQDERITLKLPRTVQPGESFTLSFTFSAPLRTDDTGLYLAAYTDDTGATVPAAATQFEATFFRRASPSFDEPAMKASFAITTSGVPQGWTAVSNMPVSSSSAGTTVAFQPTPRMSSYLVALVVSPMLQLSQPNAGRWNNVTVSVYAPLRAENRYKMQYALDAAVQALLFYETQFDVPYPLPKLDHLAVSSFAAGAMENWGCMIYRETSLLGNTTVSSQAELQRIVVVICHESGHNWFGDLVSPAWWSSLFLNEGGARFFEYLCTDAVVPQFQIMRTFYSGVVQEAMHATSFANSRSLLSGSVDSSQSIESQFDSVAYAFGGSILSMIKGFLDRSRPGSFFSALHNYFQRFSFSNANPTDLWGSFAAASGYPELSAGVSSYTTQTGYPLLQVSWQDPSSLQSGQGVLTVQQSRAFFSTVSKSQAPASQSNPVWWIPLTMAGEHPSASGPVPAAIQAASQQGGFTSKTWQTTIGSANNAYSISRDGWLKLGVNATGYSRVLYPSNLLQQFATSITAQLQSGQIMNGAMSPADRGQLVADLFFFAFGGLFLPDTSMVSFLSFIKPWLPLDSVYETAIPALSSLLQLRAVLTPDSFDPSQPEACIDAANAFGAKMIGPLAAQLNFSAPSGQVETPLTITLRSSVLSAASSFGIQWVIDRARSIYTSATTGPAGAAGIWQVDPNLQSMVMGSASRWAATNDASVYNTLRSLYLTTTDAAQKRRLLGAMAASRSPTLLQSLLQDSLNTSIVKPMDTVSVIVSVASNAVGRSLAWTFTQNNWGELMKRYGSGGFALSNLVSGTTSVLTDPPSLDSVKAFFALNPVEAAQLEVAQGIEVISSNIAFSAAQRDATCTWLRQQY